VRLAGEEHPPVQRLDERVEGRALVVAGPGAGVAALDPGLGGPALDHVVDIGDAGPAIEHLIQLHEQPLDDRLFVGRAGVLAGGGPYAEEAQHVL